MFPDWPNVPDEVIVETIHNTMDRYGADGGYMFVGGVLATPGDENAARLCAFVINTAKEYGRNYYEKH